MQFSKSIGLGIFFGGTLLALYNPVYGITVMIAGLLAMIFHPTTKMLKSLREL